MSDYRHCSLTDSRINSRPEARLSKMLAAIKTVSSKDAQKAIEQDKKAKKKEKKQRKKVVAV